MKKLNTSKMAQGKKESKPPRKKPDWRVEEDYAYTEGLDLKGWAWEALRRYEPYREAYKGAGKSPKARETIAEKYHLKDLYDPALFYDEGIRFIRQSYPKLLQTFDECEEHIERGLEDEEDEIWGSPLYIDGSQAVIVFDLTRGLSDQVKHAEKLMQERQKDFKIEELAKVGRVDVSEDDKKQWRKHIRTLDALDETPEVTRAEVAKHIHDSENRDRDVLNESQKHYEIGKDAVKYAKKFPAKYRRILFVALRQEIVPDSLSELKE